MVAILGGGSGCDDVVNKEDVPVGKLFGMADCEDRLHIVHTVLAAFVGLACSVAAAYQVVCHHGYAKRFGYSLTEQLALVVAPAHLAEGVQRHRDKAVDISEPPRLEQLLAQQEPKLTGETEVAIVFDMVDNGLRHSALMEDEERCRRLARHPAYEALFDFIVGRGGIVRPRHLGKAGGAEVCLVPYQRLATMAAERREEELEKLAEGADREVWHGVRAGRGSCRRS